jgi:outer membrane putative beta-barrel porin/alpha-amylase
VKPKPLVTRVGTWQRGTATLAAFVLLFPALARAQGDGPRSYWKGLSGTNVVPVIYTTISGNTNPFDPSHTIQADASFDATLALAGYAKALDMAGRAATVSVLFPMGSLSGQGVVAGKTLVESAGGFGDPMLQFGLNVVGPKAMKTIPDVLRYEPRFSIDVIGSLAVPIGEYNSAEPLNIGQNRWYGRVGAPVVWQIGNWAPESRTTLEFLPAIWMFGANDNFVGKTMTTDALFQLEGHLTHNFAKGFWGSLDGVWYTGGKATIDGVPGAKLNNAGLSFTAGYLINDNAQLTVGYGSTLGDQTSSDLRLSQFRVTLVYGWHPIIEGMKRLGGS